MAGPTVKVTLAGDATSLDRALDRAGQSAIDAGRDFERASHEAKKFDGSMDKMNSTVDASEGKFMGTADLLDGLGGAFGIPTEGVTNLARSFGDMAGGITSVVIPAMQSMWAVMAANPVFLVVAAVVALVAVIVIAYKKFEWFRNFVDGVFDGLKNLGAGAWDWLSKGLKGAGNLVLSMLEKIMNAAIKALTAPIGILNAIPGIKNIVPDVPTVHLPRLADGGIVTRPTVAVVGEAGPEAIIPLSRAGRGGGDVINITVAGNVLDGRGLADLVQQALLDKQARGGRLGIA